MYICPKRNFIQMLWDRCVSFVYWKYKAWKERRFQNRMKDVVVYVEPRFKHTIVPYWGQGEYVAKELPPAFPQRKIIKETEEAIITIQYKKVWINQEAVQDASRWEMIK